MTNESNSVDYELKKYKCTGYHGTDIKGAESILKSQTFIPSTKEEEWLGRGVYFFENDKRQAVDYITKAKRVQNYKIIKANLETSKLFDLIDTETMYGFCIVANAIKDRYKKLKTGKPRLLNNSVIIEIMYKTRPFDMVRGVFPVPLRKEIARTNIAPYQIQVCVREKECITKIEEVD